ncbi:SH3 domain-containing protein [Embleya sp. NPDC127516]|uniref:SH3 domain-containing protein n=1 Tax=Embleya sp. NPDC127516 TaxID=3363990 RepID=UPI0037F9CE9F
MVKKTLVGAGLVALMAFGLAAPAQAAGTSTAAASCSSGMYVKAKTNLKIRATPTTQSTALGVFPGGSRACNVAQGWGQNLDVCGEKSNVWQKIRYGSTTGWIPRACAIYP